MENKTCILIPSCDAYSDLWPIWIESFLKYWPDCPFPIYLCSNGFVFSHPRVQVLYLGEDQGWSTQLIKALAQISEQNIFLWLEDLFLAAPVNTERFFQRLKWFEKNQALYLKFFPNLFLDSFFRPEIYELHRSSPYRTSAVVCLWRKDILLSLLREGESAWEFEYEGAVRSAHLYPSGFYACARSEVPFIHGVVRGVWTRSARSQLHSVGVWVDRSRRPVMGWMQFQGWKGKNVLWILWSLGASIWQRWVFKSSKFK